MLDSDLNKTSDPKAPKRKDLDVDRFFSAYPIPPAKPCRTEASLAQASDGSLLFAWFEPHPDKEHVLHLKTSVDAGRTWGSPWVAKDRQGNPVSGSHHTVLHLGGDTLGLVHSTITVPNARTGRDGGTVFRTSNDGGKIWSPPSVIEPQFGICCTGHAIVTSNGRIVVPLFKWISHDPSHQAEQFDSPSLSYSYFAVSDDQGETWTQSLSELIISHDRSTYSLEEPAVIELADSRLLAYLRSQVGRIYRSFSEDGGISWSKPEALGVTAGYTPCCLRRIPSGEILMVWNQVSASETLCGLRRHRLSCAVSSDEGETWENFNNLESLDDTQQLPVSPASQLGAIVAWDDYGYYQPGNTQRYHRAPGVLRICYPDVQFLGEEAIIVYDYGLGTLGKHVGGIKLRAVPIAWLTGKH